MWSVKVQNEEYFESNHVVWCSLRDVRTKLDMAIAKSNSQSRGGYDYSFVDTPLDELVCKICHCPSREPYLSVCCGHTFCKTCLEDAKQVTVVVKTCPMCRKEDFTTFPNKQNERAVNNLHVFCTNKGKGCDWQGELNCITGHLALSGGCKFEEVSCPSGCGLFLERRYLSNHVDTECPCGNITCQYCTITGERQFINGQHQEQCPKLPLPCPNRCDIGTVLREDMEAHKAECPLEMIQCDYYEVGCMDRMARKDKLKHDKEKMENHLSIMKSKYLHTTSKLEDAEKEIKELQQKTKVIEDMMFKHVFQWLTTLAEKVQSQQNKMPITLRMSEYSKRKEDYSAWSSSSFSWDIPVLQVNPEIELQAIPAGCTHLSVQLHLVKGGYKRDYAHELNLLDEEYKKNCEKSHELWLLLSEEQQKRIVKKLKVKYEQQREALEQEKRECNVTCKTQCLCVTILSQISDSEHYSVYTGQMDLEADYFFKNEDCRVLIFHSPHFISNKILYTSTATCRYLKDDIIYFSITHS